MVCSAAVTACSIPWRRAQQSTKSFARRRSESSRSEPLPGRRSLVRLDLGPTRRPPGNRGRWHARARSHREPPRRAPYTLRERGPRQCGQRRVARPRRPRALRRSGGGRSRLRVVFLPESRPSHLELGDGLLIAPLSLPSPPEGRGGRAAHREEREAGETEPGLPEARGGEGSEACHRRAHGDRDLEDACAATFIATGPPRERSRFGSAIGRAELSWRRPLKSLTSERSGSRKDFAPARDPGVRRRRRWRAGSGAGRQASGEPFASGARSVESESSPSRHAE